MRPTCERYTEVRTAGAAGPSARQGTASPHGHSGHACSSAVGGAAGSVLRAALQEHPQAECAGGGVGGTARAAVQRAGRQSVIKVKATATWAGLSILCLKLAGWRCLHAGCHHDLPRQLQTNTWHCLVRQLALQHPVGCQAYAHMQQPCSCQPTLHTHSSPCRPACCGRCQARAWQEGGQTLTRWRWK